MKPHPVPKPIFFEASPKAVIWPSVVIVIPTKNRVEKLERCITTLRAHTDYPAYHIVLVDNGSDQEEALQLMERLQGPDMTLLRAPMPFHYSKLNNLGVAAHPAEIVACLNDDLEILPEYGNWLKVLVADLMVEKAGIAGPLLLYPNGRVQQAGVAIYHTKALHCLAARNYISGNHASDPAATMRREVSCVTGACLVVRKEVWEQLKGLDERYPVILNDVDFCLRARELGYRILFDGTTRLIHNEGVSARLRYFDPKVHYWFWKFHFRHAKHYPEDPFLGDRVAIVRAHEKYNTQLAAQRNGD